MSPNETAPAGAENELEILLDGVYCDLTFKIDDPDRPGKKKLETERILVRKVAFPDMDRLGKAWGKMAREVAVYTDLDEARVKQLTTDGFETAMREGRRLNFPSFRKWWTWQAQTLEAFGQNDQTNKLIADVTERLGREFLSGASSNS